MSYQNQCEFYRNVRRFAALCVLWWEKGQVRQRKFGIGNIHQDFVGHPPTICSKATHTISEQDKVQEDIQHKGQFCKNNNEGWIHVVCKTA